MEQYLGNKNLPGFLKYVKECPYYTELDLSDPNCYQSKNYKYHQYFSNLGVNNLAGVDSFFPSEASAYYQKHRVARPDVAEDLLPEMHNHNHYGHSENDLNSESDSFRSKFNSFVNVPTIFTEQELTGLCYHSAVDMPNGIHIYGGLRVLSISEYRQVLEDLTKNFTIPPENITMKFDYDLPLPMEKDKIISMAAIPNTLVYRYSPESNSCSIVLDLLAPFSLKNIIPNNKGSFSHSLSNSFTSSYSSNSSNSSVYPGPLLCSAAARLSKRFYMLYGGMDLSTEITYPDELHCIIEKKIIPTDQFWLFDTVSLRFKEIKISVHPTYNSIFSNSIARFGHSMVSVPIEDSNHEVLKNNGKEKLDNNQISKKERDNISHTQYTQPSILFIMGGYKGCDDGKSFSAMNDLWKCELFLDDNGVSDEVICCPIGNFEMINDKHSHIIDPNGNELEESFSNREMNYKFTGVFKHNLDSSWPSPRGFFAMSLIDSNELPTILQANDIIDKNKSVDTSQQDSNISGSVGNITPTSTSQSQPHSFPSNFYSPNAQKTVKPMSQKSNNTPSISSSSNSSASPTNTKHMPSASIRDLFTRISSTRESVNETLPVKINTNLQSNHSSESVTPPDITSTSSPLAQSGIHTYQISTLKSKVLIMFGGSSISYTKVKNENDSKCASYYIKSITGDLWWFDFQNQSWYPIETYYKERDAMLSVCGHGITSNGKHLVVIGGIQERQLEDECFKPVLVGEGGRDWEVGRKAVINFHAKLRNRNWRGMSSEPLASSCGISVKNSKLNYCYKSFVLNLETQQWISVDYLFVRKIHFNNIFNYSHPALGDEEDYHIVFTNAPIFKIDSKVVFCASDVKILDEKSGKVSKKLQTVFGNGFAEIFSTYLKF